VRGSRDEFSPGKALEVFIRSLPGKAWLRVLDTDHSFAKNLGDLSQACRDVIAWAEMGKGD